MKKKRKSIAFVLIWVMLIAICGNSGITKAATLKVFITEGTLNHAINRTMVVGETRDGWGIELNNDRTVKKATWSSSDTSVVTVSGNNNGATVTAHKEGTAVLTLTVVTNEEETVANECLVSVVTLFDQRADAYVKSSATFYRGAATSSEVRNTASANQKLEVLGTCGNFYRVKLPEDYDFNDELDQVVAFAKKADIEIPVTTLTITNATQSSSLKVGDRAKLEVTALPTVASRKNLTWKSSNDTIITVTDEGIVIAKKAGEATVTVTETYSGVKASVALTVSDIFVTSVSITNADEVRALKVGETKKLKVSLLPANATKKELSFSSSNEKVATVDAEGNVTAHGKGKTTISVNEIYSKKTYSCEVNVSYQTLAAKRTKSKFTLKASTDFRGNHLKWSIVKKNAQYYKVYIGVWNKKKCKVIYKSKKWKKKSYYDKDVLKGKKYHYYVEAYSETGKMLAKSKKVKIVATAPRIISYLKNTKEILLDWTPEVTSVLNGVKGYRVYRSTKKNGKYKCVKQIKKKNKFSWSDTKIKEGKKYYYKICAYRKEKKKLLNGSFSNKVSQKTYKISTEKNNAYFNSMKTNWEGVCIEPKIMTAEQSSEKMREYSITCLNVKYVPCVKYHLTSETLYIHVYVEYATYQKVDGRYKQYEYQNKPGLYEDSNNKDSYKMQFEKGLKENYRTFIVGNNENFLKGVNFRTQLIIHEKGKEEYAEGQDFLTVAIEGECPYYSSEECENNHWFHAHISQTSVFYANSMIYMTDYKYGQETVTGYQNCAAHEFGHILGLWDGYYDDILDIDRLLENEETCYNVEGWTNLMEGSRKKLQMTPNDFEMMLLAYGQGFKRVKYVWQFYNTISLEWIVSKVIIKHEDKEKKNERK